MASIDIDTTAAFESAPSTTARDFQLPARQARFLAQFCENRSGAYGAVREHRKRSKTQPETEIGGCRGGEVYGSSTRVTSRRLPGLLTHVNAIIGSLAVASACANGLRRSGSCRPPGAMMRLADGIGEPEMG